MPQSGAAVFKLRGGSADFGGGGDPMAAQSSVRDSMRAGGRDWSLLLAAVALIALGLAVSNSIVPNYRELEELSLRRDALRRQLHQATQESERLQDNIGALEDPYYVAQTMIEVYHWRYAPPAPVSPAKSGGAHPLN